MVRELRAVGLALVGLVLSGVGWGQAPTATLTIQLDKPLHAVSPTLYGLMAEEINYSFDGGLYAEMVRNRTFQDRGFGGVAHWSVEHGGSSVASMEVDKTEGPSEALQHSLLLTVKQADAANQAGVPEAWGFAPGWYSDGPLSLDLVLPAAGELAPALRKLAPALRKLVLALRKLVLALRVGSEGFAFDDVVEGVDGGGCGDVLL